MTSVFFQSINVRINARINISISIKTYDHQTWQTGTSGGFDLNETNQAGTGDVKIT